MGTTHSCEKLHKWRVGASFRFSALAKEMRERAAMQPETCRSGIPESSILLATRLPTHEAAPLRNHVVHKRRVARRDDAHARCETSVKLPFPSFPSLISFQWSTGPPCCFDSPRSSTDTSTVDKSRQHESTPGPESPARCGSAGPARGLRLCLPQALGLGKARGLLDLLGQIYQGIRQQ